MENFKKCLQYLFAIWFLLAILHNVIDAAGCEDNQSCTDLCGYAGAGECVNKTHCKCANCPQRSVYELVHVPSICTLDPTCVCPLPTFSLTAGKIYTGHRCLHLPSIKLVCICYCMPTTLSSVVEALKCPFPKPGSSHSSNSTTEAPTTQPSV